MGNWIRQAISQAWATRAPWLIVLRPLTWLYTAIVYLRARWYQTRFAFSQQFDVPVWVIGNIVVGGGGKTPMVIALAKALSAQGKKVGIVTRGYGGACTGLVLPGADAHAFGDEPVLIAQAVDACVLVHRDRLQGIRTLIETWGCNHILCDDGLQDKRLKPAKTIVMHPFAPGEICHVLPEGPLREPLSWLSRYDQVFYRNDLPRQFEITKAGQPVYWDELRQQIDLQAYFAIARPQQIMELLQEENISASIHLFADHYPFALSDFKCMGTALLMTAKDAVKCRAYSFPVPVYIIDYKYDISRSGLI